MSDSIVLRFVSQAGKLKQSFHSFKTNKNFYLNLGRSRVEIKASDPFSSLKKEV